MRFKRRPDGHPQAEPNERFPVVVVVVDGEVQVFSFPAMCMKILTES